MPNEITASDLLQSDFARIDQEVDRIAMAYCEARLVELAQHRDSGDRAKHDQTKERMQQLRDALLHKEDGSLVHLLYWLDIRADYYANHKAPKEDATPVVTLLHRFAKEAHQLQLLAQHARQEAEGRGEDDGSLYRNADALHSITEPHRHESH